MSLIALVVVTCLALNFEHFVTQPLIVLIPLANVKDFVLISWQVAVLSESEAELEASLQGAHIRGEQSGKSVNLYWNFSSTNPI